MEQELTVIIGNRNMDTSTIGYVTQVAEIDIRQDPRYKCRLVSDPEDRLVVGFAVWERRGESVTAQNWRKLRHPPMDHKESA